MKNYFIKANYITNPPITLSQDPENYWTPKRIKNSYVFQFHVYEYAKKILKKNGFRSILDIGSGPGTKLSYFFNLKHLNIDLIDQPGVEKVISPAILNQVNFYGQNIENDIINTGKKYELVICADVIEHLVNPDSLLTVLKNHLTDNGLAILSTPDRDLRWGKKNNQSKNKAHVREWNFSEFAAYLKYADLDVIDHFNLPLKKLHPLIFKLSQKFLYKKIRKSTWFPCQVVVLKKTTST